MPAQLWWYVARSCGILSWVVVTASVLWGLVLSSKGLRQRFTAAWLLDLHRYLGGLSVVFLALHIGGLVGDSYVHFGPSEVLVPLASHWRPGAVGWGIAAFYLLIAVELTSLARRRLPVKVWRATHGLAFPLYAMATGHLLLSGTDARTGPLHWAALASAVTVAVATAARVVLARRVTAERRRISAEAAHMADAVDIGHVPPPAHDRFGVSRPAAAERRAAIARARAVASMAGAGAAAGAKVGADGSTADGERL